MSDEQLDPLRLVVQHMEQQLDDRVEEVSDAKPSREETTQELIQLEETLSSAQDKAKKLVTLRLKLEDEEATDGAEPSAPSVAGGEPSAPSEPAAPPPLP